MSKALRFLLLLLSVLIIANSTTYWDTWNTRVTSNGYVPSNPSFAYSPPTNWTRYKNTASPTLTPDRKQQYKYNRNISGNICTIYCGIWSFLVADPNSNTLYCRRDTTSDYWGDSNLSGYKELCVPNFSFGVLCAATYSLLNSQGSTCTGQFSGTYNNGSFDCCYQNGMNLGYTTPDEVDFTATTSTHDLVDTEPWKWSPFIFIYEYLSFKKTLYLELNI